MLKAGISLVDKIYSPDLSFLWKKTNYFIDFSQQHNIYIDLIDVNKFKTYNLDISSFSLGFLNKHNKIDLTLAKYFFSKINYPLHLGSYLKK